MSEEGKSGGGGGMGMDDDPPSPHSNSSDSWTIIHHNNHTSHQVKPNWILHDDYGFISDENENIFSNPEQIESRKKAKEEWKLKHQQKHKKNNSGKWKQLVKKATNKDIAIDSKEMVRDGVPRESRSKIWMQTLRIQVAMDEKKNKYQRMLEKALSNQESRDAKTIEGDLHRTFPNHPMFSTTEGLQALKNCLLAYSVHDPSTGYCQSMNYVAGIFLLFLDEEQTFWALDRLIGNILPRDYYAKDLMGAHVDLAVLKSLIQKKMKKMYDFLALHRVDISVICLAWFLCLFVNTLPIESVLRVWDALFLEGSKVLFRVSLALFRMNSKQLFKCQDSGEIYSILSRMGNDIYDSDELLSISFNKLGNLRRTSIDKLREGHRVDLVKASVERQKRLQSSRSASPIVGTKNVNSSEKIDNRDNCPEQVPTPQLDEIKSSEE